MSHNSDVILITRHQIKKKSWSNIEEPIRVLGFERICVKLRKNVTDHSLNCTWLPVILDADDQMQRQQDKSCASFPSSNGTGKLRKKI